MRRNGRGLLLALAMLLICALAGACGSGSQGGDAAGLIEGAAADLDAGRSADAVTKLKQAVAAEPLLPQQQAVEAHYLLGNAYAKLGQFAEAEQEYLRVLELDANHADARANLGVVLYNQGKLDRAEEALRAALAASPDDAELHYNLGGVLAAQNKLSEALEHFNRATLLDPNLAQSYLGLGSVYKLQGQNEQAVAALRQYLERSKDETWRRQAEQMIRELGAEP